jgi:hypothetical protein
LENAALLKILFMVLVGFFMGCDQQIFFLKDIPSELTLEKYGQHGELISEQKLNSEDLIYKRLRALLQTDKADWKISVTSYKTGPYILRGENLIIRCYQDKIVIDVNNQGKSTSFQRELPNLLQQLGLVSI